MSSQQVPWENALTEAMRALDALTQRLGPAIMDQVEMEARNPDQRHHSGKVLVSL